MNTIEYTPTNSVADRKIYTIRAIQVATFLGGPLVAGYLIAENYKAFNEYSKIRTTWIYAVLATVVIFGSIFLIPDTVKIPTYIIPLVYSWITYGLVQHYQQKQMDAFINAGGTAYSWWRTVGIALIGVFVTLGLLFGFIFIMP